MSFSVSYGFIHHMLRVLLYPWISRVRLLNADLRFLQDLEKEGQLIFVGHGASFIDFLIINDMLKRNGIGPLQFTNGINPILVKPFRKASATIANRLFKSESTVLDMELSELCEQAAGGGHGLVFLKRGPRFMEPKILFYRGFFGKVSMQVANKPRRVSLVPASVFLTRLRKQNSKRSLYDIFFGTYDIPGRARKLYQLLLNYRKGGTAFSKHIDLNQEMSRTADLDEDNIEKRIRWTLLFHLNNEDRAYRGPTKRSKERKVRKILKERRLNEELKKVAERQNRPLEQVLKEASKNLHEIASDTSERVINLLRILFDFVWARTLEGIDIKQEDLARIRELTRHGPVVVLPCHRSHVDYLVVGYLFEKYGLNFPRIASGDNLSKWPLGVILRRAGAFFLRRSFKGEAVFPLVFDAYIRHVLRQRHVLIFFMEGTRSRTGKLLHPKLGLMSMLADAWREGVVEDLPLVPLTIDYGKVFEGQAYVREKSGQEKQRENLRSVIQSRKVLRRKHGIMRLRFGEPVFLSQAAKEAGFDRESLGFKARVPFLNDLGFKILNEINRRVTLTAGNIVAGLLLGTPRRGMTLADLKALFVISVRYLKHRKIEMAFAEKKLDIALANALDTFAQWDTLVRVEVGGETVINIPENKRSEMEYYKNNGLHFILELALFCMAFRCLSPEKRTLEGISAFAKHVYKHLDQEFLFGEGYPDAAMMERAYRSMENIDALKMNEQGKLHFGEYKIGRDLVLINAHLLLNFLESYFVVAEVLSALGLEASIEKKQLLKQCMVKARLLYAVGTLRRIESMNHVTFANALAKFNDMGFIKFKNTKGQKSQEVSHNAKNMKTFLATKNLLFRWMIRLD